MINAENIEYYYGDVPEEIQLEAVRQDEENIRFIKNPSEQVQLELVKKDGEAIYWIYEMNINPSEHVQLEAVRQNGLAIEYIKNPTEKVKQMAKNKLNIK